MDFIDGGGASSTWIGTGDDAWNDWDGCTPIAGSMISGYYESVEEYQDNRGRKSSTVSTSQWKPALGGWMETFGTEPQKIDDGSENYDYGFHNYDAKSYYVTDPGLAHSEIGKDQPYLLNMQSGDRAEDETTSSDLYQDHSVCVTGYVDNGSQLHLNDTWNDEPH